MNGGRPSRVPKAEIGLETRLTITMVASEGLAARSAHGTSLSQVTQGQFSPTTGGGLLVNVAEFSGSRD